MNYRAKIGYSYLPQQELLFMLDLKDSKNNIIHSICKIEKSESADTTLPIDSNEEDAKDSENKKRGDVTRGEESGGEEVTDEDENTSNKSILSHLFEPLKHLKDLLVQAGVDTSEFKDIFEPILSSNITSLLNNSDISMIEQIQKELNPINLIDEIITLVQNSSAEVIKSANLTTFMERLKDLRQNLMNINILGNNTLSQNGIKLANEILEQLGVNKSKYQDVLDAILKNNISKLNENFQDLNDMVNRVRKDMNLTGLIDGLLNLAMNSSSEIMKNTNITEFIEKLKELRLNLTNLYIPGNNTISQLTNNLKDILEKAGVDELEIFDAVLNSDITKLILNKTDLNNMVSQIQKGQNPIKLIDELINLAVNSSNEAIKNTNFSEYIEILKDLRLNLTNIYIPGINNISQLANELKDMLDQSGIDELELLDTILNSNMTKLILNNTDLNDILSQIQQGLNPLGLVDELITLIQNSSFKVIQNLNLTEFVEKLKDLRLNLSNINFPENISQLANNLMNLNSEITNLILNNTDLNNMIEQIHERMKNFTDLIDGMINLAVNSSAEVIKNTNFTEFLEILKDLKLNFSNIYIPGNSTLIQLANEMKDILEQSGVDKFDELNVLEEILNSNLTKMILNNTDLNDILSQIQEKMNNFTDLIDGLKTLVQSSSVEAIKKANLTEFVEKLKEFRQDLMNINIPGNNTLNQLANNLMELNSNISKLILNNTDLNNVLSQLQKGLNLTKLIDGLMTPVHNASAEIIKNTNLTEFIEKLMELRQNLTDARNNTLTQLVNRLMDLHYNITKLIPNNTNLNDLTSQIQKEMNNLTELIEELITLSHDSLKEGIKNTNLTTIIEKLNNLRQNLTNMNNPVSNILNPNKIKETILNALSPLLKRGNRRRLSELNIKKHDNRMKKKLKSKSIKKQRKLAADHDPDQPERDPVEGGEQSDETDEVESEMVIDCKIDIKIPEPTILNAIKPYLLNNDEEYNISFSRSLKLNINKDNINCESTQISRIRDNLIFKNYKNYVVDRLKKRFTFDLFAKKKDEFEYPDFAYIIVSVNTILNELTNLKRRISSQNVEKVDSYCFLEDSSDNENNRFKCYGYPTNEKVLDYENPKLTFESEYISFSDNENNNENIKDTEDTTKEEEPIMKKTKVYKAKSGSGLSTGAIIGIIVASLVAVGVIVGIAIYFAKKRKNNDESNIERNESQNKFQIYNINKGI